MRSSLVLNVYFARATPTYLISELVWLAIVPLICRNEVNDYTTTMQRYFDKLQSCLENAYK